MIAALGEGAGDHVDILIWSMIEGSLIRDRHEMVRCFFFRFIWRKFLEFSVFFSFSSILIDDGL